MGRTFKPGDPMDDRLTAPGPLGSGTNDQEKFHVRDMVIARPGAPYSAARSRAPHPHPLLRPSARIGSAEAQPNKAKLRGYGTMCLLSQETPGIGQPAVVAGDMIAVMDALKIEKAAIAGYVRSRLLTAARRPAKCPCRRRPSSNGGTSSISSRNAGGQREIPARFRQAHVALASAKWAVDDATFNRSVAAFWEHPIL